MSIYDDYPDLLMDVFINKIHNMRYWKCPKCQEQKFKIEINPDGKIVIVCTTYFCRRRYIVVPNDEGDILKIQSRIHDKVDHIVEGQNKKDNEEGPFSFLFKKEDDK